MSLGSGIVGPIKLDGLWDFQFSEVSEVSYDTLEDLVDSISLSSDDWLKIRVPSAWENQGISPYREGIGIYRRFFDIPEECYSLLDNCRFYIRFNGVSAWAEVLINGIKLGCHEGIWSPFEFEITNLIKKEENELIVKVIKPGRLLSLRESLAGFLPDVCMPFGGIWQPVELILKRDISIKDIDIKTDIHTGILILSMDLDPGDKKEDREIEVNLYNREIPMPIAYKKSFITSNNIKVDLKIDSPHLWCIDDPYLYTLDIKVYSNSELSDRLSRKIGWREIRAIGSKIYINGSPVYIRGILHWGWYPETVSPTPTREMIREEILKLKALGFNLIKHCLYVPPQEYFELTDEMGMLVWEELPLWIPEINEKVKEKIYIQYEEIIHSIRHYSSIILWTLGCELDKRADYQFLNILYTMVKSLVGDTLVRDNSGSGECYGGFLKENADFYDYHFYTDPHFYRDLLDNFAARWREEKPWFFGEFCDSDTIRDIQRLIRKYEGLPWWIIPKGFGIRWNISYHRQVEKMRTSGLLDRLPKLVKDSIDKSFIYRKLVLELVRKYENISGYVITGMRDTPIATSGVFDDLGRPKYSDSFQCINSDTVITLDWDNKRSWVNGGDRLIKWDKFNYWSRSLIRPHIIISYYGKFPVEKIKLEWFLENEDREVVNQGEEYIKKVLIPGTVEEIYTVELVAPDVQEPTPFIFKVKIYNSDSKEIVVENFWYIWIYPRLLEDKSKGLPIVTTTLTRELLECIKEGERALYLQPDEGNLPVTKKPFWRESMHIMEKHPILRGFDDGRFHLYQWYSLATDTVFTSSGLEEFVMDNRGDWQPILRRLDARNFDVDEYLVEITLGRGIVIASTLRFHGGLGDEADGISLNPAAEYLFYKILEYLIKR